MILNLAIAFGAGLISFLSPCVLPLIPGYISYISGESLGDIIEKQKKIVLKTILFTVGFSLVFIGFGATASLIGNLLLEYYKMELVVERLLGLAQLNGLEVLHLL